MTNPSRSAAARGRAAVHRSAPTRPPRIAAGRAASSPRSRTRPAHRRRRSCAPRWKPPSAPPTPMAPGTGRPPMTPARRRRSCSCASSARPCARKPASPAAMLPMLAKIAGLLPTHTRRSEESQALPAVLDADPARPRGLRRRRDHARRSRAGAFGRHRPARHPRRARRRLARPQRAGRDPRRRCSLISFRASPSRASTPRRSTIISTPASRRASC